MELLIFAASHRPESVNRKLATLAAAHVQAKGSEADVADYSAFDMPLYNDAIATHQGVPKECYVFADRAAKANGIIIASPEYNWSYPGTLKNILDWTSRLSPNPLAGKTALLMSATPGMRGGIIGMVHLKTPLEALQMFVFPRVFPLGNALNAFKSEQLIDEKQRRNFILLLDDYLAFTRKLS